MKKLMLIFVVLLFAIWLGFLINKDSGYLLLSYGNWVLETSFWVALSALTLFFLLLYLILRLINQTFGLKSKLKHWKKIHKNRKASLYTDLGLCELAEGHWNKAEKRLVNAAHKSRSPLINYLAAAHAAQAQGAYDRRDNYLRNAHESNKKAEVAIGLTQAQLQMQSKQWERALATLKHINQLAPHHKFIYKILSQVYLELKDWNQLENLLPHLKQYKIFPKDELDKLEKNVFSTLLEKAGRTNRLEELEKIWSKYTKYLKSDPELIDQYSGYLIEQQQKTKALSLIESTLKSKWHSPLVKRFGLINGKENPKQLKTAETWLKHHPTDSELLLCLGRLCIREKFWGKARDYLESSLKISASKEAYKELGYVFEMLNNQTQACQCYQDGLNL